MDIFSWFHLGKESVLASQAQSSSDLLLIAYFVIALLIKRPSVLAAFFMSCMLFEVSLFDPLSEASLYLITFAMYSYVIFCKGLTLKSRLACGILLILSITLAYDAYHYGIDGAYGEAETVVYNNIEYAAVCAHIILISTLIPYRRIGDGIRHFINTVLYVSRNSAYFVPI